MINIAFLLGVVSLVLILFSVIIITISYRRLTKGMFRSIFTWLLHAFFFMSVPYTLFVFREVGIFEHAHDFISLIIYSFMVVVTLMLMKASLKLNKFSKSIRFAKPSKSFIKKLIENAGKKK